MGLKKGDTLNLMSSAFVMTPLGSLPKQEIFKVAGIFNTGFLDFDQNIAFVNIEDALSIFEKDKDDQSIEIYLDDPLRANIYKDKIQKINQNYFIYTWSDLNKSLFSALKVERNVMFIILSLIIVVAAFNIIFGRKFFKKFNYFFFVFINTFQNYTFSSFIAYYDTFT